MGLPVTAITTLDPNQPCNQGALQHLNDTRPYRLIATCLLHEVLRDNRLTDFSKVLWLWLYSLCNSDKELAGTFSHDQLARQLDVSPSSIRRAIQLLKGLGYLEVEAQFNREKGQQANRLAVRAPAITILKLWQTTSTREERKRAWNKSPQPPATPPQVQPLDDTSTSENTGPTVAVISGAQKDATIPAAPQDAQTFGEALGALHEALNCATATEDLVDHANRLGLLSPKPTAPEQGRGVKDEQPNKTLAFQNVNTVVLSTMTAKRIFDRLRELKIAADQAHELIHQIDFALANGQLKGSCEMHSVNIAIRLIRSNRWRRPRHYQGQNWSK